MQPVQVSTNLLNVPSSRLCNERLGFVLIIGPWNYPLHGYCLRPWWVPFAGNCVVLESIRIRSATAAAMKQRIEETFRRDYVLFVEGEG